MKRTTDQRPAVSGPQADEKSPRRRSTPVGSRTAAGVPSRPVTVRLPDLTPPVEQEGAPQDDDPAGEEVAASAASVSHKRSSAGERPEGAARADRPKKHIHKPHSAAPVGSTAVATERDGKARDDKHREEKPRHEKPRHEKPREEARAKRETSGEPPRERADERRRRESQSGAKKGKAKVGIGPMLIGMGVVGLILAGYAAVQKNQQGVADTAGESSANSWPETADRKFTAPQVNIPGQPMSAEEFAKSSAPSAGPAGGLEPQFNDQFAESDVVPAPPRGDDAQAPLDTPLPGGPGRSVADVAGYDAASGASSASPEPGHRESSSTSDGWQDTPLVTYGRVASAPPSAESANAETAAYPTTDPSRYQFPVTGNRSESYRVGQRETIDVTPPSAPSSDYSEPYGGGASAGGAPSGAAGGSFQRSAYEAGGVEAGGAEAGYDRSYRGSAAPDAGRASSQGGYGAATYQADQRSAPAYGEAPASGANYRGGSYGGSTYRGGERAYSGGSTYSGASDPGAAGEAAPAYSNPPSNSSQPGSNWGGAPAYEPAYEPAANSQPRDARLQGAIQPSYNGSRYERPRSSVY